MRSLLVAAALLAPAALAAEEVQAQAAPILPRTSLDFGVGYRFFGRSFTSSFDNQAAGSWQGPGNGVLVEGHWYPAAAVTPGLLGNLGLFGEGRVSLGLNTSPANVAARFPTRASLVRGGLALRLPLGQHELLVTAGVSLESFAVAPVSLGGLPREQLWDVGYLGPRLGVGYAVALTPALSARARLGLTWALSEGELGTVYTQAQAWSLDAQLGLALQLLPAVKVAATLDLSRTAVSLGEGAAAQDLGIGGSLALVIAP